MHELIEFLIEERYCYTQSEALRILESVSDEFYNSLIEAYEGSYDIRKRAPERLSKMRRRLTSLTNQIQKDPSSATSDQINAIKKLRAAIPEQQKLSSQEMTLRKAQGTASRGLGQTPRGPGGSRFQQGRDVIAPGTIADVAKTSVSPEREATRMTGISPGSTGTGSVDSGRPRTSVIVSGRYKTPGASGGRGTRQARSGGIRGVRGS